MKFRLSMIAMLIAALPHFLCGQTWDFRQWSEENEKHACAASVEGSSTKNCGKIEVGNVKFFVARTEQSIYLKAKGDCVLLQFSRMDFVIKDFEGLVLEFSFFFTQIEPDDNSISMDLLKHVNPEIAERFLIALIQGSRFMVTQTQYHPVTIAPVNLENQRKFFFSLDGSHKSIKNVLDWEQPLD